MRRSAAFAALAGLAAVLALGSCSGMSSAELKGSLEISVLGTKWVKKYYQPWPPRLILVPQIAFRAKNVGTQDLTYVFFNGVFKFRGETGNLGDQYLQVVGGKALKPGEETPEITLTSNFGVEGRTAEDFPGNAAWRPVVVRLFARTGSSNQVLLGEYDISRTIDFKPDEAVAPPAKKDGAA